MKRSSLSLFAAAFCGFVCNPSFAVETVIRYPLIPDRNLNTVSWTGTQFVAAGEYGAVQTSPDGIVWASLELPDAPEILCSAAANGRAVLGGGLPGLLTSSDGQAWEMVTLPNSLWAEVTRVGGLVFTGSAFRATSGRSSESWTSSNGVAWSKASASYLGGRMGVKDGKVMTWRDLGSGAGAQQLIRESGSNWATTVTDLQQPMKDLVWTGSRYITVGKAGYAGTSLDGTTWTLRTTEVTAAMTQMIWTGSLAVAVGTGGTIITSPNGAAWTAANTGTTADFTSIAWSGSIMVAVGKRGAIYRSMDGASWSAVREAAPLVNANSVAWTGTSAIAVGPGGTLVSPDGVTWTRTAATDGPTGQYLDFSGGYESFRVAAGPDRIVASDGGTGLWYAPPDVSSWTKTGPPGFGGTGLVWDGHQYVALLCRKILDNWKIYVSRSDDGLVWSESQLLDGAGYGANAREDNIIYDDLLFTGSSFLTGGLRSTDGVTWVAAPFLNGAFFARTAAGVVAVSPGSGVKTSVDDGLTWTGYNDSIGSMDYVKGMIWTGSNIYAVIFDKGVFAGGPGSPWWRLDRRISRSIAWTGTRAIVSDGTSLRTLEDVDSGLPVTWPRYLQSYFSTEEVADPAVGSPLADPDHDEFTSAVEYMFGTSPVSYAEAPVLTLLPAQGAAGPRLQWRQDTGRPGISVQAEVSYDLDVWDIILIAPIDGTAGGMRTMQATAPPVGGKGYIRLHVTLSGN